MEEREKSKGYLIHKGPRGGGWCQNKKYGLVRQKGISNPETKEDAIRKYCRRNYNLILFCFLDKNSRGWRRCPARFLGDHWWFHWPYIDRSTSSYFLAFYCVWFWLSPKIIWNHIPCYCMSVDLYSYSFYTEFPSFSIYEMYGNEHY